MKETKKLGKKNAYLREAIIILIFLGGYFLYMNYLYAAKESKFPAGNNTALYEKFDYNLGRLMPPYKMSYYLLPPKEIIKGVDYPLLVVLHGGTGKAYAAGYMAQDYYRHNYPGYVLMPVAPYAHTWWDENTPLPGGYKNALPYAVEITRQVADIYPIDKGRVYVVGCSVGGGGAIISSLYYQDVFAAAVAVAGFFDPRVLPESLDTPLAIIQGDRDSDVPVKMVRTIASYLKEQGASVSYNEFKNRGHECPAEDFYPDALWNWLYTKSKPYLR